MKAKVTVTVVALAAVIAGLFLFVEPPAQPETPPAAAEPAPAAEMPVESTAAAEVAEPAGVAAEPPAAPLEESPVSEEQLDSAVDKAAQKMRPDISLITNEFQRLYAVQDEIYDQVPRYAQVKERAMREAEALLSSRGIEISDTEKVLALVQEELDAFFDAGGLNSADAFQHGYVARALSETAVAADGDNFALLTALRESISTTTLIHWYDWKTNPDAVDELWPTVEKQKDLILSGKEPLSSEAMLAMYDWQDLVRRRDIKSPAYVETWQWIVDNADVCGWGKMKPLLEKGLASVKQGNGFGTNLYAYPASSREEHMKALTSMRGLPSLRGDRNYREKAAKVWEEYDRLYHGPEE